MNKIKQLLLSLIFFSTQLFAFNTAPGVENNPDNYLGIFWQGQAAFNLSERSALSTLVELGNRNYRINETLGVADESLTHRFKIGVEYLKQNIDYTFYSGVKRKWVNQVAAGLAYQWVADTAYFSHLDIEAFYSHAPNHNLPSLSGTFVQNNNIYGYINDRRIAGSDAGGVALGGSTYLWRGAELGLAANYDYVKYDTYYDNGTNRANGLGGTATFSQYLGNSLKLDALAEARAPFNYYEAGFSWLIPNSLGRFSVGVYGSYVNGKRLLPNTKTLMVNFNYLFGAENVGWSMPTCPTTLNEWTNKPAVYLPQVLAIKDEKIAIRTLCALPVFVGPAIANQTVNAGAAITPINAGALFSSNSDLTFALVGSSWGTVTIDPTTGVISGNAPDDNSTVTYVVQATNRCGVTVSNTFSLTATCVLPQFIGPNIADQSHPISTAITNINAAPLFTTTGTPTYSLVGSPPGWGTVTIDPNTGVVSGDTAATASSADYTVSVTDDCGSASSNEFTLTAICDLPEFIGPDIADQTHLVSSPITNINTAPLFTTTGTPTYSLVGSPPGWGTVAIDSNTGVISGNTAATVSSADYTVSVTDDCGSASSNEFTLTACDVVAFVGPNIPTELGLPWNTPITPINTAPSFSGSGLTFSLTGSPAPWGTININSTTGVISGSTPNGIDPPFSVSWNVVATSSCGTATSNLFSLVGQNS